MSSFFETVERLERNQKIVNASAYYLETEIAEYLGLGVTAVFEVSKKIA
ncbi:MAG: hypothetical protein U9Q62_09785 [Campylobacterota bacterium]|nr:hypothetical protein [Campylobacterota bacterium]